jgi:hypothetical protein
VSNDGGDNYPTSPALSNSEIIEQISRAFLPPGVDDSALNTIRNDPEDRLPNI